MKLKKKMTDPLVLKIYAFVDKTGEDETFKRLYDQGLSWNVSQQLARKKYRSTPKGTNRRLIERFLQTLNPQAS